MRLPVPALTKLILFLSLTAMLIGVAILFFPFGKNLMGDGSNSSAITTAIALIVGTIGLVLATYMQSAEYQRETELVDDIQSIRIILEIMISRTAALSVSQPASPAAFDYQLEKEALFKALTGPAGRLLVIQKAIKTADANLAQKDEKWRTFYLSVSEIMNNSDLRYCASGAVSLLRFVEELDSETIRKLTSRTVSTQSVDELSQATELDILVKAGISTYGAQEEEQRSLTDTEADELERVYLALNVHEDIKDNPGLKREIHESYLAARKGQIPAYRLLVALLQKVTGDGQQ